MRIYSHKGLLTEVHGISGVASYLSTRLGSSNSGIGESSTPAEDLVAEVTKAFKSTSVGEGVVRSEVVDLLPEDGRYYVGVVQPVLHYTMGGLAVSPQGHVLTDHTQGLEQIESIPLLYAAGEIMGGVHGENRLGGSSLLDCVVFGREAANTAYQTLSLSNTNPNSPIPQGKIIIRSLTPPGPTTSLSSPDSDPTNNEDTTITPLLVTVGNRLLDLSNFKHPGGLISLSPGEDLTGRFQEAHGDDWALLERPDIKRVNELSAEELQAAEEQEEASYVTYGGDWGRFVRVYVFYVFVYVWKYHKYDS